MAAKIYTKKGDQGDTSILGPQRYSKADIRICAIGDVDELNASLGFIYASIPKHRDDIHKIQSTLFVIGAQLALDQESKYKIPKVQTQEVEWIENAIDSMENTLPPMTHFILPSGDLSSSYIHMSRAICRRAERTVVSLSKTTTIDPILLKYLNRLSDFLFVLSRYYCAQNNIPETKWIP